jgi:hypothetical protein
MALVLADRVRETTTVVGTGTATLLGAITGFQSFAAVGNANTTYYTITHQSANEWEVGIGTYTSSGTTLSRDTVLSSSNSGSLVNFSAGTKDVWVDYSAEKAVTTDTLAYPPAIGGTTPAAGTFTTLTATGQTSLGGVAGAESFRAVPVASSAQYIAAYGAVGQTPYLIAEGANANINLALTSKGASGGASNVRIFTNGLLQEQLRVSHTASAVNYVNVTGAATGGTPTISAQGSDATVPLNFQTKGVGIFRFRNGSNQTAFTGYALSGAANFVGIQSSVAGSAPILGAEGADTNIDLDLVPKGTGTVVAEGPFTATGQTSLGGVAGSESLRILTPAATGAWAEFQSSSGAAQVYANAGSGNVDLVLNSRASGNVRLRTAGGTEQFRVSHTASAVNYVQVTGAATGSTPTISVQGSDADVGMLLQAKGARGFTFQTRGGGTPRTAFVVADSGAASVNYLQPQASLTGNGVQFSAQGADTNISQVFQSKGTGAINLAPGSSGVNISNGGTVTAITLTNAGSGYTSFPTLTIAAPTTAGGVQATASFTMRASPAATIASGGTGYTVGDVLTFTGGTFTSAIQVTVATVSSGVITGITSTAVGSYSVLPSNPISVTGGTGSGATFNQTWGVVATFTITNAGSGYVEQPTVTFSGGGGSGAAAYATVGGTPIIKGLGSNLDFYTANAGIGMRLEDTGGVATGYFRVRATTGAAQLLSTSSMSISSSGANNISLLTNGITNEQLRVAHTASAVNFVQVTGGVTAGGIATSPTIGSQGSDTNVSLNLNGKGNGGVRIGAQRTNFITVSGSGSGGGLAIFTAEGGDTNISVVLQPKGTGALQAQQTDSTATGGNARGVNAVDWQTGRNNAVQVASGPNSVLGGGFGSLASGPVSGVFAGNQCQAINFNTVVLGGTFNVASGINSAVVAGTANGSAGFYNFMGGGFTNSGTSGSAVTTQSATMNGTAAVTLSGSNGNIRVGQYITGTSIANETYVAAISGTSLTLSRAASGSSTSTLSFFTPHGVVVGGGNNQATGAYSFIGGGGDAGTAANRNVASGSWSTVGGGSKNVASGNGAVIAGGGFEFDFNFGNTASGNSTSIGGGILNNATNSGGAIVGGWQNTSNGVVSSVVGGRHGTTRAITGNIVFPACNVPVSDGAGVSQSALLLLGRVTTDATATRLTSDSTTTGQTTNQVILPNNSAYFFRGEVVSGVTGGGNTKGWTIEGVIKRGANAASTTLVGTPTVTSSFADAGASTWVIAVTADTTNGGLAVTFTGQAGTTIRVVAQIRTTEMTF